MARQPLRVVILEDSPDDAELMLGELRKSGYDPHWKRAGTEADYVPLLDDPPDVILADYSLPGFDSYRAIEILQERGLDVPLLVLTGSVSEEAAVECIKKGAADYLLKDRLARLGMAVAQAIEQRKLREEARRAEQALRESEERFRRLTENAQDIIYRLRLQPSPGFEYVNPAVEAVTGYTPEEHYADPELALKIVHPEDLPTVEEGLRSGSFPEILTLRWIRKDERVIWIEQRNVGIRDEARNVAAVEGIARDITERKTAEEALRRREAILEAVAFAADRFLQAASWEDAINEVLARLGEAADVNRLALVQNHIGDDGVLLASVTHLWAAPGLDPRDAATLQAIPYGASGFGRWEETFAAHGMIQGSVGDLPESGRALLSSLGIRSILAVPVFVGDQWWGLIAVSAAEEREWTRAEVDALKAVSDALGAAVLRKRADEALEGSLRALRRTDDQRRKLLSRLVEAQEEERKRIASDIHDDSIQVMTAVGLRLQTLKANLTDEEQFQRVEQLASTVQRAITRLRRLLFELRPPALDEEGLAPAIRLSLEQAASEAGFDFSIDNRLTAEPPLETRAILFRLAQEAMSNARKHSGARNVQVTISEQAEGFRLRIADDGVGFEVAKGGEGPLHLGIVSMRERAEMAGGWCRIESAPGEGTRAEFWVPAATARQGKD